MAQFAMRKIAIKARKAGNADVIKSQILLVQLIQLIFGTLSSSKIRITVQIYIKSWIAESISQLQHRFLVAVFKIDLFMQHRMIYALRI